MKAYRYSALGIFGVAVGFVMAGLEPMEVLVVCAMSAVSLLTLIVLFLVDERRVGRH